jgi:hypothetical protein
MSKQAAPKLVHGALNVVWEKLETLDFLGVGTQAPPEVRWGPQGRKSNGLTSLRPAIHLKSSTFATPIPNHFRRGGGSATAPYWKSLLKTLFLTVIAIALGFQTQKCLLHICLQAG